MPPNTDEILPSFKHPPVGEVALTVQFDRLENLNNADILRFWSGSFLKEEYSEVGEYAEMPPFREVFGVKVPRHAGYFTPIARTVQRYNFRNRKQHEQVQVQQNQLAFFWQEGGAPYPRFPYILKRFSDAFTAFSEFCGREGLGSIQPNQCSIYYRNVFLKGREWQSLADIGKVVTMWKPPPYSVAHDSSLDLDHVEMFQSYVIREGERPVARLYAMLGEKETDTPSDDAMELLLLVRGAPQAASSDAVDAFFKMGRSHIVREFKAFTTPAMHQRWGEE